jgi:transcriptional regulator with XRE-family HTH domain
MSDWKYPGDDAVRRAFVANVLRLVEKKGLTLEEFERRMAETRENFNEAFHERAFGRAVKKLREERNMTRKALAAAAEIPIRMLILIERGHGGELISVPEVCRIAVALKLRPHELMSHYQDAVVQADSSQAWWLS